MTLEDHVYRANGIKPLLWIKDQGYWIGALPIIGL